MDRELIAKLAQEAGLSGSTPKPWGHKESVERFAALVAAHEREECAKVVWATPDPDDEYVPPRAAIAAAIRSRT